MEKVIFKPEHLSCGACGKASAGRAESIVRAQQINESFETNVLSEWILSGWKKPFMSAPLVRFLNSRRQDKPAHDPDATSNGTQSELVRKLCLSFRAVKENDLRVLPERSAAHGLRRKKESCWQRESRKN